MPTTQNGQTHSNNLLKQLYLNSTGALTILCLLIIQGLIPYAVFFFEVLLIAPVLASAALYWTHSVLSNKLALLGWS